MSDNDSIISNIQRAEAQTDAQLAKYGSIDRWPTLTLAVGQYPQCECGHSRAHSHVMVGTERGPCRVKGCTCRMFVAVARMGW